LKSKGSAGPASCKLTEVVCDRESICLKIIRWKEKANPVL